MYRILFIVVCTLMATVKCFADDLAKASRPMITADSNSDSDDRWTVPFGGGAGCLVKFGKQQVDSKLQYFK